MGSFPLNITHIPDHGPDRLETIIFHIIYKNKSMIVGSLAGQLIGAQLIEV